MNHLRNSHCGERDGSSFNSESFAMINAGKVARELRESLRLTQREMARELGITNVRLCLIETGKSFLSRALMDRLREKFEVDPYVLAWCRHARGANRNPASLRQPAAALAKACDEHFETIVRQYRNRDRSR
jgi:transcriptional regulator with XRE-family HTH domain